MADDNKIREDGPKKGGGEFRVPPRTYILWIAILGAIPLLMVFKNRGPTQADLLNQIQFTQFVRSNLIVSGKITAIPPTPEEVEDEDHLELARIGFNFNKRDYGRLRLMIDVLNGL